jgi:hypothetical protein
MQILTKTCIQTADKILQNIYTQHEDLPYFIMSLLLVFFIKQNVFCVLWVTVDKQLTI